MIAFDYGNADLGGGKMSVTEPDSTCYHKPVAKYSMYYETNKNSVFERRVTPMYQTKQSKLLDHKIKSTAHAGK